MKHFIKLIVRPIMKMDGIFYYKDNMANVINGFSSISFIDIYYTKYCSANFEFNKKPHIHIFDGVKLQYFWIIVKNGKNLEFNSYEEYLLALQG